MMYGYNQQMKYDYNQQKVCDYNQHMLYAYNQQMLYDYNQQMMYDDVIIATDVCQINIVASSTLLKQCLHKFT